MLQNPALEMNVCVDIGIRRSDRFVPQPVANGCLLDSRLPQMARRGVTEAMRGESLLSEFWTLSDSSSDVFFRDKPDAKASKAVTSLVDKEIGGSGGVRLPPVALTIKLQKPDSGRPQRRRSWFISFTDDFCGPRREVKAVQAKIRDLLSSGPSVVQKRKDREVSNAIRSRDLRLCHNGFDLRTCHRFPHMGVGPLERDSQNSFRVCFQRRMVKRQVSEERLNHCQPLIACPSRVPSPVLRALQVLKKRQRVLDVNVGDAQGARNVTSVVKVGGQKLEGVAVALDGVGTQ